MKANKEKKLSIEFTRLKGNLNKHTKYIYFRRIDEEMKESLTEGPKFERAYQEKMC